jgi:hypothetical protein
MDKDQAYILTINGDLSSISIGRFATWLPIQGTGSQGIIPIPK